MKKGWKHLLHKIREDYFSTPFNAILTLIVGFLIVKVLIGLIDWAFIKAVWVGDSNDVAVAGGATWAFIGAKLRFFFYGFYPAAEIWRVNIAYIILAALVVPFFIPKIPHKILLLPVVLIVWPLALRFLVQGGFNGLVEVDPSQWGGFALTLILASTGLFLSFPLGILLALGRRSEMPVIRAVSTAYIEFFRGIPLITILFMSSVVVPFFFPPGVAIAKILRITVGLTIFQSAYLAEIVRGGFQSIPKGQYEAADSLGFSYVYKNYLIILPQALKIVISNIGGISISFIKDTTLVQIIGMFDLLGIVRPLASDTNWLGMDAEGLIFAGIVYWILCFIVSKITAAIERKAGKLPASAVTTVVVEGEEA